MEIALSHKQLEVAREMDSPSPLIMAGGAARSGKSLAATVGFLLWAMSRAMQMPEARTYIITGRSLAAIERNILEPHFMAMARGIGARPVWSRGRNVIDVGPARFWIIGASDVRARERIQGMTAAGALVDEVALLPREYFDQIRLRCSVEGSKIWATFNPEAPTHWLKQDVVDYPEENGLSLHRFGFEDNPSLSEDTKQRYKKEFTGHFYQRFVEGDWAAGSGLIYPDVTYQDPPNDDYDELGFGMDYAAAGTWSVLEFKRYGEIWYATNEIYEDFRNVEPRIDEDMVEHLIAFIDDREYSGVYIDPATYRSFKRIAQSSGVKLRWPKVERVEGIRHTQALFKNRKLLVGSGAVFLRRELESYSWDEKRAEAGLDEPVKGFDHAADALRYFVTGRIQNKSRVQTMGRRRF